MFIIIFGTRERNVELDSGQFYCSQCDATRPYKRYRAATYFTLFFIPLFRVQDRGEYVECQVCQHRFRPEALAGQPPSPIERLLAPTRADLESGTPVQMAQQKLINASVDVNTARTIVDRALGPGRVSCLSCGLSYHERMRHCSSCGAPLQPDSDAN